MSVQDYSWLYAAAAILTFLFHIAAAVFLFTKWSRFPRPTRWAVGGFGLMIIGQIAHRVSLMAFSPMLGPDTFVLFNLFSYLVLSILHLAGLCMLIVAVYVDRTPQSTSALGVDPEGRSEPHTLESNPYAV